MRISTLYRSLISHSKFAGIFLVMLMGLSFLILLFTPKIAQWSSYHHFADSRQIGGISNFWNVVSNSLFLLVSFLGFRALNNQWQNHRLNRKEALVFLLLFSGIFLIGLGSSYYHWSPDNDSLVWDRLPITIVFMSLLSLTIMERVNFKLGFRLLIPLVLFGIFSVLYWHQTEAAGQGDLRLYGLTQFYSMLLIVFILIFYPKPYPPLKAYLGMLLFYLLAKLCEYFDAGIYQFNGLLSGHTLKHIFAAISTYFIVIIVKAKGSPEMTHDHC